MRALAEALRFLTVIPIPGKTAPPARVVGAYPWAGLVIGIILASVAWIFGRLLGLWSVAVIVVASKIIITGGLHLDGLADFADGLGGGDDREKRLTIMEDSRLGSYGALALLLVCALQTIFIAECLSISISPKHLNRNSLLSLALVPAISRGIIPLIMKIFPVLRVGHLGDRVRSVTTVTVVIFALCSSAIIVFACLSFGGLILMGSILLLMVLCGALISFSLGGLTGDCYGTIIELGETFGFFAMILLLKFLPDFL